MSLVCLCGGCSVYTKPRLGWNVIQRGEHDFIQRVDHVEQGDQPMRCSGCGDTVGVDALGAWSETCGEEGWRRYYVRRDVTEEASK